MRFGRRSVLESVDLAVHVGEIVTLAGLDGAGKSTLVRVLPGILEPSRGEVVRAPGLRIGHAPQHVPLVIIPAAAARRLVSTPGQMVAAAIGAVPAVAGLFRSLDWDVPTGPAIVLVASGTFAASLFIPTRGYSGHTG